ncbi:hypothetical protein FKM82_028474 [Ascaphus truei]
MWPPGDGTGAVSRGRLGPGRVLCLAVAARGRDGCCVLQWPSDRLYVAFSFLLTAVVGQAKLLPPQKMKHCIKLVDEYMNWCDSAIEFLLDQTDALVVGVLGLQGTGKSTLMSLLSANSPEDDQRSYVFRMQSQEVRERAGNQTSGIDFFISQERIIFLDTQVENKYNVIRPCRVYKE